jgi:hypothetical protein
MARSKQTDAVIREVYVEIDVPADIVATTAATAEEFRSRVNARLPKGEQFSTAKELTDYLLNIRRRGSKKGGLPKIRNGHGPGGRASS